MDITHDRASEVARRLIAGSFRRDGERLDDDKRPRFSIPTRIDHDDDTVIVAYIDQQREKDATIAALRKRVEELEGALKPFVRLRGPLVPAPGLSGPSIRQSDIDRVSAALRAKGGEHGE